MSTEPKPPRPTGPANIMPGGTMHTAGGEKPTDVSLTSAAASIKWSDWTSFPTRPCVRDSLLTGIGAGFAVAGVRTAMRAPVLAACNWAVGSWCVASFAAYQYCSWSRTREREGMRRAMEIMDRKAAERKQKEERVQRARELRRQKKEEEDQAAFARLRDDTEKQARSSKSWWKVW